MLNILVKYLAGQVHLSSFYQSIFLCCNLSKTSYDFYAEFSLHLVPDEEVLYLKQYISKYGYNLAFNSFQIATKQFKT